jgi:hypothetical protein
MHRRSAFSDGSSAIRTRSTFIEFNKHMKRAATLLKAAYAA